MNIYTVHVHVHKETIDIHVITNVYKTKQRERGERRGKRRGEREGEKMRERDERREGGTQCICSH